MDKLISLFAETLAVAPDALTESSSPSTIAKWDSLAATALVVAIEETFAVKLSTREIMSMNSVGRAREVLKKKGVAGI